MRNENFRRAGRVALAVLALGGFAALAILSVRSMLRSDEIELRRCIARCHADGIWTGPRQCEWICNDPQVRP